MIATAPLDSLVSAVLAFGISRLVLEAGLYAITSTWSSGFGDIRVAVPPADWRVALFLIAGALVSTVFFALAPALRATRLELVRAMRGEVVRDARPNRARNALVALQVTGSVLLLGGSLTAALGAALLATPAAELIGSTVRLFDPAAYAASLLFVSAACACAALVPALRAGRLDPIAALRQD